MQASSTNDHRAEPPLFVAMTDASGRRLMRIVTQDDAIDDIDGRWHCEAVAPSGLNGSGWCTFGSTMAASVTYGMILGLMPRKDVLSLWYWPSASIDAPDVDELEQVVVWAGNVPAETVEWRVLLRTDSGALVALETDANNLTLQIPIADGPALFMPFRVSDRFHVAVEDRDGDRLVHWRLASRPGLATAYWAFHRAGNLDAAAALAVRLLTSLEGGNDEWPGEPAASGDAVAVVHAAVRLRALGKEFRDRVRTVLNAGDEGDIDLVAARWLLRYEVPGERFDADTTSLIQDLSERLMREMPHHTEILRLLFERYRLIAHDAYDTPSSTAALRGGLHAVSRFARAAEWDFDTLAYHASAPWAPANRIDWDDVEAFVRTEKKSPESSPGPTDIVTAPSVSRQRPGVERWAPLGTDRSGSEVRGLGLLNGPSRKTIANVQARNVDLDAIAKINLAEIHGRPFNKAIVKAGRLKRERIERVSDGSISSRTAAGRCRAVTVSLTLVRAGREQSNSLLVSAILVRHGLGNGMRVRVRGHGTAADVHRATTTALHALGLAVGRPAPGVAPHMPHSNPFQQGKAAAAD